MELLSAAWAAGLGRGHQMELNHRPVYSLAGYSCREGLRCCCLSVSASLKVAPPLHLLSALAGFHFIFFLSFKVLLCW